MIPFRQGPAQGYDPLEHDEIEVGDRLLVLVAVHDRLCPGKYCWEPSIIVATETGWDDQNHEPWYAWDWYSVDYWYKLEGGNLPPIPQANGATNP